MTPDTAVRVMDALAEGLGDTKKICIHLYGGEPFTNLAAIRAMVKRAKEFNPPRFTFAVTTNGTVLSDAVIDVLDAGKFQVVLSIDGPTAVHDECRRGVNGAPTHNDVMRFLDAVRSRTSCYVWGAAVVRSGWRLIQATEYLRTLPVHAIKAQAVRLAAGTPYALTPEEHELYKEDLRAVGRRVIEELEAGKFPLDNRFGSRVLQLLVGGERVRFCDAGNTNFGITPSGSVLACLLLGNDARLGHIDDDPHTWREAGRKWKARPLRSKCHSCKYLAMCGGGCPAALSVCGEEECDIVAANCDVATAIFEHFKDNKEDLLTLAGITD